MESILFLAIESFSEWVLLLVVIPIAQRLADFSTPGLPELAWKLIVIVAIKNVAALGVTMVISPFYGEIAGIVLFLAALTKVLDLDVFGAIMIVLVSWMLRNFLLAVLLVRMFA